MATSFENKDGIILKDGEEIGKVEGGAFVPNDGLHHQTVKAVENWLNPEEEQEKPKAKAKKNEEPEPGDRGDLDAELVKWRKDNWDEKQFNEVYPKSRLIAAGLAE
jgi:hypothetical protein